MSRLAHLPLEKKLAFGGVALALLLIVGTATLAPAANEDDPLPTSTNAGPAGAKALWTLLPRLGYRVQRSELPLTSLATVDAPHTTLLLANPWGTGTNEEQQALAAFLDRGGRVLATGYSGEANLPGYYWQDSKSPRAEITCTTAPAGTSALAAAGPLHLSPYTLARTDLPEVDVAQRCAGGAAVIGYRWGKGTAVWWTSPEPLTNRGLHEPGNLALLLASLGSSGRTVLVNEADSSVAPASPWSKTRGIPLAAMVLQLLLALVFLVLAYGRRHGPVRTLSTTPRTSPLEFAHSMGNLYHRAGAGEAATQEARARLLHLCEHGCGIAHSVVYGPADALAAELQTRFGYTNPSLSSLLQQTGNDDRISPARALALVRALDAVHADLGRILRRTRIPEPTLA